MGWLGKLLSIPILIIGAFIFIKSLDYYYPDFSQGFLLGKKYLFMGYYKWAFYAHIISSPAILLIGSIQAFFRLEKRSKKLHKILGSTYSILVILIGAPSGFVLAFEAIGGFYSILSFTLLSSLWFYFSLMGVTNLYSGNLRKHKQYMIRSYILALSAIMLRLFSFLFIHFSEWKGEEMYILISWLSWAPCLMVYEIVIRQNK